MTIYGAVRWRSWSLTTSKMQVFNFPTALGWINCVASICSAAVVSSPEPITAGSSIARSPANLTSPPNAPVIRTSGHYLPGTLPRNPYLGLITNAMGSLAHRDGNDPFPCTVFRPTDPNLQGVEISVVPVPSGSTLRVATVLFALYDISYKVRLLFLRMETIARKLTKTRWLRRIDLNHPVGICLRRTRKSLRFPLWLQPPQKQIQVREIARLLALYRPSVLFRTTRRALFLIPISKFDFMKHGDVRHWLFRRYVHLHSAWLLLLP